MPFLRCEKRYVNCTISFTHNRAIYRTIRDLARTNSQQMAGPVHAYWRERREIRFPKTFMFIPWWFDMAIIIIVIYSRVLVIWWRSSFTRNLRTIWHVCNWLLFATLLGFFSVKLTFCRYCRYFLVTTKLDLQQDGCGDMDWIGLAQDRDRWWALVNAVMNLRVPARTVS